MTGPSLDSLAACGRDKKRARSREKGRGGEAVARWLIAAKRRGKGVIVQSWRVRGGSMLLKDAAGACSWGNSGWTMVGFFV